MPSRPRVLGSRRVGGSRREHDAKRRITKPWRRWYCLAIWREIRAAQLAAQPLCERHLAKGETVAATVCNHRRPHRGDWDQFVAGPFESLCKACHDGEVQREERAALRG
jgi:5-methylcytosine-specific restriction protein A